jgi:hypothetical protein
MNAFIPRHTKLVLPRFKTPVHWPSLREIFRDDGGENIADLRRGMVDHWQLLWGDWLEGTLPDISYESLTSSQL